MKADNKCRGFITITHPEYLDCEKESRLVQESSKIGTYEDSMGNPGSSYLWIGKDHHLNREEVGQLIFAMQVWLDFKRLPTNL